MTITKASSVSRRFSEVMSTCGWLAAVLVVFIHGYNVEAYGSTNPVLFWIQQAISQGLSRGAVPFFMLSSAYFTYRRERRTVQVYAARAKSVAVPYLLWNTVYMIAFMMLGRLGLVGGVEPLSVKNLLMGVFVYKYNYTFWFMLDLLTLIALYPLIRWLLQRGKWVSLLGLVGMVAAFCFVHEGFEGFIYYYIGGWLGHHAAERTEAVAAMSKARLRCITAVLLCVGGLLFVGKNVMGWVWLEMPRNLTAALLLFFAVASVEWRVSGKLTSRSFMIYALHPLLLEIIENGCFLLLPHNDVWMTVSYVLSPTLCIALIVGVCLLWQRWLPKTYGLFSGGRGKE